MERGRKRESNSSSSSIPKLTSNQRVVSAFHLLVRSVSNAMSRSEVGFKDPLMQTRSKQSWRCSGDWSRLINNMYARIQVPVLAHLLDMTGARSRRSRKAWGASVYVRMRV